MLHLYFNKIVDRLSNKILALFHIGFNPDTVARVDFSEHKKSKDSIHNSG